MDRPLRILLDERNCSAQMRVGLVSPDLEEVADPACAEAIIFCEDKPSYVRGSPYYRAFPGKCIVISGADVPTFYLPAIYSSNHRHLFARGRTGTCDYFMDDPNPSIREFKNGGPPKKWLLSFVGGSTSWPRKRLFRMRDRLNASDVLIKASDDYQHWTNDEPYIPTKRGQQKAYAEIMAQSWFVLCPRGAGRSSIRLFEAMEMGVCPIIVADGWIPPEGPDWSSFALFLPEAKIGDCVKLARANVASAGVLGRKAQEAFELYFSAQVRGRRLGNQVRKILSARSDSREWLIHRVYFLQVGLDSARGMSYRLLKRLILGLYKIAGRKFPYQLNRPAE